MRNKKGQALVEFVIILPIFIFMLLAIIDVGKIIFIQNRLENKMSNVLDLYRNQKSYDEKKNITYTEHGNHRIFHCCLFG